MELNEVQLVFFFKEPKQLSYDEFSYLFRSRLNTQSININFHTSIFPIPSGVPVPSDIPRCQILTNDQKFKITLSLDRCDINCNLDKTIGDIYTTEQFYEVVNIVFNLICNNVEIKRFGHVANFILVVDNPKKLIAEKLLKPKLDEPLVDAFVQFGRIDNKTNMPLNKIYQFRSALRQNFSNAQLENIIFAVKDFNTNENSVLNNSYYTEFINKTSDIINPADIMEFIK